MDDRPTDPTGTAAPPLPEPPRPARLEPPAPGVRDPFWSRPDLLLMAAIVALSAALYLPRLDFDYIDPWEPHYSQVAWEMREHGTWVTPWYRNGTNWWSKPVFHIFSLRVSTTLLGDNETASRLPSVLAAIAGALLVYLFVSRLWDRKSGLLAALVLATSPQYFFLARQAIPDMQFVVLLTGSLLALAVGLFRRPGEFRWLAAAYVLAGLCFLAKGLFGLVFPAAAVGLYVLLTGEWNVLRRIRLGWGLLIFAAVALPWYAWMTSQYGMPFLREFFWQHHFERMAGAIGKKNFDLSLYVQVFAYGLLPWSALAPAALVRLLEASGERPGRGPGLFLFLAGFAMYALFGLSSTKYNHYLFPCLPLLAVAIGRYLAVATERTAGSRRVMLEMALGLLLFWVAAKDLLTDYKGLIHLFIYYYDRAMPAGVRPQTQMAVTFGLMSVAFGWILLRRRIDRIGVAGLGLSAAVFAGYCNFHLVPETAIIYSQKPVFLAWEALADPAAPVCEYHLWERRSVSHFWRNRTYYINPNRVGNRGRWFVQNKGRRWYCMVDKTHYASLQNLVRKETGEELSIVYRDHPTTYLVSNLPPGVAGPAATGEEGGARDYLVDRSTLSIPNRQTAEFDGRIRLLGWAAEPAAARPGEAVNLSLWFSALAPVGSSQQIFIHAETPEGRGRVVGDHLPAGGRYTTDRWQPGEVILDRFTLHLPPGTEPGPLEVWVGLFEGNRRMKVSGSDATDGADRVRTAVIRVR